ncbi:MAG: BatD family protein [bacterium]|jgi:hypothetical protein|nr:hypothetical protein [Planctomycetota bacterium]HIL52842.1 hypothetical protein [Planctomycetota bacterium]
MIIRTSLTAAFCGLLALFCATPAFCLQGSSAPRVTAQLSSGVVKLGATVTCTVQVEGARNASLGSVPPIDKIRLERASGPSINESLQFINGRQSYSRTITFAVTLRPLHAGEFVIPPIALEVDGRQVFTRELSLRVVEDLNGQELGRLSFLDVPERIFEGQPFTIRMNFGWDTQLDSMVNTANLILPWWNELPGTLEVESPAHSLGGRFVEINVNSRVRVRALELGLRTMDGKPFRMLSLSRTFVATRSGVLGISQSWLEFGRVTRRAFSESRETYHSGAAAFSILVEPLPEEGRPFDFSGGVGQFEVKAEVSRRDVDVADSIKLTVDWTGDANLEFFVLPDPSRMEAFKGFRVYGKSGDHFYGDRRRVIYDLAPLSAEVYEVPPLSLSVFDPVRAEYVRVETERIPLRVRALVGEQGLAELEGSGEALFFSHDIQTRAEPNGEAGGVSRVLLLASWVSLPALWLVARRVVRKRGDPNAPAARRRRGARRALIRALRETDSATAQAGAWHKFLAARSGEDPEAWEGRDGLAWCAAREEPPAPELGRELMAIENGLDESRWAGDDAPVDPGPLKAFADRWQKEGL